MWASRMIFAASRALVSLVQCTTARVQMSPTRIDLPPTSMAAPAVSSGNAPVRLAPPADLELALFFHMLEFEIALIRVVDGLADGAGERHVGRGHEHAVVLVHDVDDPLQGPLLGRLLTAVENQVQDLDPVLLEERTAEEQEAGRHLVPDAVARGTGLLARVGWLRNPLPAAVAVDGAAFRADGRLGELPPELIRIVDALLDQAVLTPHLAGRAHTASIRCSTTFLPSGRTGPIDRDQQERATSL